ncbi:ribonucleases P/MRP protein subunit [Venturia nashicola]|nr:ribonucleases P/MRP protein subunit [Venturia nashicola]
MSNATSNATSNAISNATPSNNKRKQNNGCNNTRQNKRPKIWDARKITAQTSDKALSNGELNVDAFVKAREFEIKALEDSIKKSKHGLTTRAFQEVPKELRRRTASHNVRKVPKRLQRRAKREMVEDNTPTISARRRKPSGHQRLRLETAKRLQNLSSRSKKRSQEKKDARENIENEVTVEPEVPQKNAASTEPKIVAPAVVAVRKAKVKKSKLKEPPLPPAKFRKRQIHKTWLPTHMFHAKRATMTPPKEPLWRFALPLTPTIKNYRSTHRVSTQRGAVAWDMSYMATISLEGPEKSIEGLLKALGVGAGGDPEGIWSRPGSKWRRGTRTWEGWLYQRQTYPAHGIAPATVMWCAEETADIDSQASNGTANTKKKTPRRKAFIRVHPAGFLQLWEQVVRIGKIQKPSVTVEDLRFEIGSIEITGPNASEAIVAVVRPVGQEVDGCNGNTTLKDTWSTISAHPPSALPKGAVIAFEASDPRLRYPPRTLTPDQSDPIKGIQMLANWPLDTPASPARLFDRNTRLKASRSLPSQKSINRRKASALPGDFPEPRSSDPSIPVLVYCSRSPASGSGIWTILLPWKCVDPVWRSIMYYPLSTGGNVKFGGVKEKRQIAFESGTPWYPADYPGLKSGDEWEAQEQAQRKAEWLRRPKGRRTEFQRLSLGNDKKGEIGMGWACDWQRLLRGFDKPLATSGDVELPDAPAVDTEAVQGADLSVAAKEKLILQMAHLPLPIAIKLFTGKGTTTTIDPPTDSLITVKLTMVTRGVPQTCARIYRLPTSDALLRSQWLSQLPTAANRKKKDRLPRFSHLAPEGATAAMQRAYLAASILAGPTQPGDAGYPVVPDEDDLIGFVTTGNYNLGEGRGIGIGSLLVSKVLSDQEGGEGKERCLCIVRDAGQSVGRLARWELV